MKITSRSMPIGIHREREAFMAEALFHLPIVDKDQAQQDIDSLRGHVRGRAGGLYVNILASQAQDGNPIASTIAIEKIREELRALAGGMPQMGRRPKPNGT